MNWLIPLLVTAIALPCVAQQDSNGFYAREGKGVSFIEKPVRVPSPDGSKVIEAIPGQPSEEPGPHDTVTVQAFGKTFATRIGHYLNAEVLWSPDSRAFLLTYSEGGSMGPYRAKIVYVRQDGIHVVEPVKDGLRLIREWCFYGPETPEIAGIGWSGKDSSRVLIAVSVPGHTSCACFGVFSAFEINVADGKVLRKWNQIEAKKSLADKLGVTFANRESDEWVANPERGIPHGFGLTKKPKWYGHLPQER
jgi:hypothetical protein